ncbi:MAG: hypothetical protein WDN04_06000 [Rhodospirillales bacterium]
MEGSTPTRAVRVWDAPVRLFHWALVALLATSYVTAQLGELEWHMRSGYCVLALLLFRVVWGFCRQRHRAVFAIFAWTGRGVAASARVFRRGLRM